MQLQSQCGFFSLLVCSSTVVKSFSFPKSVCVCVEGGDLLTYIWPITMYTLLSAMLLCASATPLNLPHSAPNGSHAGPVCWGYLDRGGIAASKADSVRRGALQKPTNPILVRDHNPNNFHMVFKQEGAVIYGWLWAVASVRVCVCVGVWLKESGACCNVHL